MTIEEAPDGPHKIARNGQVVIPKDVLQRANLTPGQSVYVAAREGIVELVPVATLSEWVRRGRGVDRRS